MTEKERSSLMQVETGHLVDNPWPSIFHQKQNNLYEKVEKTWYPFIVVFEQFEYRLRGPVGSGFPLTGRLGQAKESTTFAGMKNNELGSVVWSLI